MGQTNGTDTPFEENTTEDQREVANAEDSFQEYNMLTPAQLEELRNDGSPEALERLRTLAEQYDIPFEGHTAEDIINRVRSVLDSPDASYMYHGTE